MVTLQQRNYFKTGDTVEFFGPEIDTFTMTVGQMWNEENEPIEVANHPLQIVKFKVEKPLYRYNMMRRKK